MINYYEVWTDINNNRRMDWKRFSGAVDKTIFHNENMKTPTLTDVRVDEEATKIYECWVVPAFQVGHFEAVFFHWSASATKMPFATYYYQKIWEREDKEKKRNLWHYLVIDYKKRAKFPADYSVRIYSFSELDEEAQKTLVWTFDRLDKNDAKSEAQESFVGDITGYTYNGIAVIGTKNEIKNLVEQWIKTDQILRLDLYLRANLD